jgi:hypothetical protein
LAGKAGDTCNNVQVSTAWFFRDTIIRYHIV